jgi:hypothetical protein
MMRIQVLQDGFGNNTGVYIPMNDWNIISQKHQDLKELVTIPKTKRKISELAGLLSSETANAMLKEVEESRKNWEERLSKQF